MKKVRAGFKEADEDQRLWEVDQPIVFSKNLQFPFALGTKDRRVLEDCIKHLDGFSACDPSPSNNVGSRDNYRSFSIVAGLFFKRFTNTQLLSLFCSHCN